MSLKYEVLKRLVKASGLKKRWVSQTTEELLEGRRRQNAKNRIPELKGDAFTISRIDVMGFPVLKLIHKQGADHANLFLIGGGMITAPRPGSVKKALRFAKETGLDLFVPYYPLCTEYPITKAYEMMAGIWRWAWCRISMTGMTTRPCRRISWRSLPVPAWTVRRNGSGCWSWTRKMWPSRPST